MEGSLIRGGLALCEHAQLKMGAKIYGATTIGPYCKIGGEVNNVIFEAYSNKGHDGFLGNSVIGEWCNLGADTNTSNLKNNYSSVRTYSYALNNEIQTDLQFMGLIMGDFSKSGINTMFNTATVVGVSCTIFGSGFPNKHIASFSWVNEAETSDFILDKAIEAANNMMQRRNLKLSPEEQDILAHLSKTKP
jgi:UDP-N-acetylglucosamine diphosphorylase/glucosamine-1-phosphate N-acetyltransferase